MRFILISIAVMIGFSACSPIQDSYKPLYQATPEKQEIQTK